VRLFQQLWYGGNNTKLATVHRDYAVVLTVSVVRIVVVVVLLLFLLLLLLLFLFLLLFLLVLILILILLVLLVFVLVLIILLLPFLCCSLYCYSSDGRGRLKSSEKFRCVLG